MDTRFSKMKNILILAKEQNERVNYLHSLLNDEYKFLTLHTVDETLKQLRRHIQNYFAVIIDNPSNVDRVKEVIKYIKEQNDVLLAIPAIILTDEENKANDEEFLDSTCVAMIKTNETKKVISQRIVFSSKLVNSLGFDDFSEMLKVLPSLIYLKDAKGRYVFCSQYWNHLERPDDPDWTIRGKTDLDIRKDKVNAKKAMEADLRILRTGEGVSYVIEEKIDGNENEYLQLIKEPVKDENGRIKGIIAIVNNITEHEKMRRELHERSITDQLTGLYNRFYFNEFVDVVGEHIRPLTIITADCDGLKEINDKYGHPVGDDYIKAAAEVIKENTPESSIKIRTGGDEFIIVLPSVGSKDAKEIIKNLVAATKEKKVRDEIDLSVSYGFSTVKGADKSFQVCISNSDKDMYKNKRAKKRRHKVIKDEEN